MDATLFELAFSIFAEAGTEFGENDVARMD